MNYNENAVFEIFSQSMLLGEGGGVEGEPSSKHGLIVFLMSRFSMAYVILKCMISSTLRTYRSLNNYVFVFNYWST